MGSADAGRKAEVDVAERVFGNSPNMLVLCLTVIGLIKIYTRFDRVTTLADNFLAFIAVGYLAATILSYLAIRASITSRRARLSRAADLSFLISLVTYRRGRDLHHLCPGRLGMEWLSSNLSG